MIDQLSVWVNSRPWLNVVFLVFSAFSLVLSCVLYLKGKREKLACYNAKSYPLIQDQLSTISAVQVLYMGQTVQNLILTKVAIWNRGSDSINSIDVAPAEPLRIEDDSGGELLDAKVATVMNPTNHFRCVLSEDKRSVLIEFDYIGRNEGAVIDIYHTGPAASISVHGVVKGYRQIELRQPEPAPCFSAFERLMTSIDSFANPVEALPKAIAVPILAVLFTPLLPLMLSLMFIDNVIARLRPVPPAFRLE